MADPNRKHPAAERVWRAMPDGAREELAAGLPSTDLQSLLIDVAAARAARVGPADLVARWRRDRFVQPSRWTRPASEIPVMFRPRWVRLWKPLI